MTKIIVKNAKKDYFHNNNYLYFSDCGDECVMNPKGFCKAHCSNREDNSKLAPDDLIKSCEIIISNLLYRILQFYRNVYSPGKLIFDSNDQF
jgi:hypothetical protein